MNTLPMCARRLACLLVMAIVPAWAAAASAQTDTTMAPEEAITVEKHGERRVPILLESFAVGAMATGDDTKAVYDVVARDLDYANVFRILEIPRLGPGDSLQAGSSRALVRGTVVVDGDHVVLQGVLESLPDRAAIFTRDYRTRAEWYREAAHRFADDIVLYLTGQTGIARTRIAFISDRSGNKEVYTVDYDGSGLRQITRNGSINMSPTWTNDGTRIVFVSFLGGDPDLFAVDLASGRSQPLVTGEGVQSSPSFSRDGSILAYSETAAQSSDIYTVDADGKRKRRLTRLAGINTSPTWSPDGRRLVFTSDRSGNPQLYLIDAEGGSPRRLTFFQKWNDLADWSPAGDRIAYASRRDGLFRICVVDPSGLGEERQLTYGPGNDEHPTWAPDGRHLVFASTRGGRKGLYVLDVDSGRIRPLVVDRFNNDAGSWSGVPPR